MSQYPYYFQCQYPRCVGKRSETNMPPYISSFSTVREHLASHFEYYWKKSPYIYKCSNCNFKAFEKCMFISHNHSKKYTIKYIGEEVDVDTELEFRRFCNSQIKPLSDKKEELVPVNGSRTPRYEDESYRNSAASPYGEGNRTPMYGDGSRTPGFGNGAKTPNYGGGTPRHVMGTPNYNNCARTPNYMSGSSRSPRYEELQKTYRSETRDRSSRYHERSRTEYDDVHSSKRGNSSPYDNRASQSSKDHRTFSNNDVKSSYRPIRDKISASTYHSTSEKPRKSSSSSHAKGKTPVKVEPESHVEADISIEKTRINSEKGEKRQKRHIRDTSSTDSECENESDVPKAIPKLAKRLYEIDRNREYQMEKICSTRDSAYSHEARFKLRGDGVSYRVVDSALSGSRSPRFEAEDDESRKLFEDEKEKLRARSRSTVKVPPCNNKSVYLIKSTNERDKDRAQSSSILDVINDDFSNIFE